MSEHADRIRSWLEDSGADAEFLTFETSVHTVEQAVSASGYPIEEFTKAIAMVTASGEAVIALVPADSRASTERVKRALDLPERPRVATAGESETLLGQQLGGNCPFGVAAATVLVDPQVAQRDWILTGGGDDRSLVRIAMAELRRIVSFMEVRVRK